MTLTIPVPTELYGDRKSVRAFARRLARSLYRSDSPDLVLSKLEYTDLDDSPVDILLQEGNWTPLVNPMNLFWRICEVGVAMQHEETKLFDACDTKSARIKRLDEILLCGMDSLWFTLATLNIDWVDYWHQLWRDPADRQTAAASLLAKYQLHASLLQSLSPRFLSWGSSGLFGSAGAILWTSPIAKVMHFATAGEAQLDVIAEGGDLCAAMKSAGFKVF